MSAQPYSLEYVGQMIDFLDKHIDAGTDTPAMHATLQQRLDTISMAYANDPRFDKFYPHMLELQALLHGRRSPNETDEKALRFMKEAVREVGSVGNLRSATIKSYIANHTRQAAVAANAHHVRQRQYETGVPAQAVEFEQGQGMQEPDMPQRKPFRTRQRLWSKFPRLNLRKPKIAVAAGLAMVVVIAGGLVLVPRASVLASVFTNHSKIAAEKKLYDTLTAAYQSCASKLSSERSSINTNNMQQLDSFNQEMEQCQAVQQQQQQAADMYNKLISS